MASARALSFILPSPTGQEVLAVRDPGGWTLPACEDPTADEYSLGESYFFNGLFRARYGLDVHTRYVVEQRDPPAAAFVLEAHSSDPTPPADARWVAPADLHLPAGTPPWMHGAVAAALSDASPSRTMPWSRPGGLDEPIAWLHEQLDTLGIGAGGHPEQVSNAYVSCVLRCATDAGDVYLKLLPPLYNRELEILRALGEWGIAPTPEVLALDAEHRRLLMRDMGGYDLGETTDLDVWEDAVRELARLQRASMPFVADPAATPLHDWRVPVMRQSLDGLVEAVTPLLAGCRYSLSKHEQSLLRAALPGLRNLCREIEDYGIAPAIEHGDLHGANIRVTPGGPVVYDWAWSAVSHPFLSLDSLLHTQRRWLATTEGARARLRDAYLAAWSDCGTMEGLRSLFDGVDRLKTLYYVLADAAWLRDVHSILGDHRPVPFSADAWTLGRRRHYLAKSVRRLLPVAGESAE